MLLEILDAYFEQSRLVVTALVEMTLVEFSPDNISVVPVKCSTELDCELYDPPGLDHPDFFDFISDLAPDWEPIS